jgi:hypothetical protein
MQSDYFDNMKEVEKAANIFINHHSIRECIWYYTSKTLSNIVATTEDKQTELIMQWQDKDDFVSELLCQLEEWELYDLCKKVKEKSDQFDEELQIIFDSLVREELIEIGLTLEDAEKAVKARREEDLDTMEYYANLINEKLDSKS